MAKKAPAKAMTKTDVFNALAEATGLTKKQVSNVFEALSDLIGSELGKKGPGQFTVPGLLKLKTREARRPRRDATQSVHGRRKDDAGQARQQDGQGHAPEEAQGHGVTLSQAATWGLPVRDG